ncbi:citron-like protein, partial [Mycena sanguinolenta]
KVFELKMLSSDDFFILSLVTPGSQPALLTGKVTCFVPFYRDGQALVAVGCAEGVWIGLQHHSQSMQRVIRLEMVTQCAMLEDLGIFIVLANKTLFAYRIEALLPGTPPTSNTPDKLGINVQFFRVGSLLGRTFVILMERNYFRSIFYVLEPDTDRVNGRTDPSARRGTGSRSHKIKSGWFRIYKEFCLRSEAFDIEFLQAKMVILCKRGFEILDLSESKSVRVPRTTSPRLSTLAKRCDSCRPMGMFRATETE